MSSRRSTKAETLFYAYLDSPIGALLLVADEKGLRRIDFPRNNRPAAPEPGWIENRRALGDVIRQLEFYFAGKLDSFDLPLSPAGTEFQQKVWQHLCDIPYGETISYGELAKRIGNPNASRAVGLANGSNPIPIIIPCHRVIGSNGKLTGYGGGLPIKEKLLALERRQLTLL
ncbi:MAG TPA: methylated-DNA--[protein]-cysteine S-methyltransferase [Terriglobales bacterium]